MKKLIFLLSFIPTVFVYAQQNLPVADCEPPMSYAELNINNVRARIHSGGDMWWDLQGSPKYEVPKGSGANALFAGALWIGGLDDDDQLHIMAQRFRQLGIDAYTGPLVVSGEEQGTTDMSICREYDRMYEILRDDVIEFRTWFFCQSDPNCNCSEVFPNYVIPESILKWPAHGPAGGYAYYLAPFYDVNEDGVYNPYDGDFPYFEFPEDGITDNPDCIDAQNLLPKLYGDQSIWWVYNDAGNEHGQTGGLPLGIEVHAQAFAYADHSVLNDQTFYNYTIINRSSNSYHDVYVGMWTDVDVGGSVDDYVGCDVSRGLGYAYNGDDYDENYTGNAGYAENPPAIGMDFFSGLYAEINFTDDPSSWDTLNGVRVLDCSKADFMNGNINGQNFEDGIVDNERLGMNHFRYFGCAYGPTPMEPEVAWEYYLYLQAYWRDNTPLYYGGTGHVSGSGTNIETTFMWPGNPTSDPCGWGQNGQVLQGWSEETESNLPYDRRFVMSQGPLKFDPGAVNDMTIGVIWARGNSGAYSSVEKLKKVDDAIQSLFDRCFRVLDGPDAPVLNIVELDEKLALYIENTPASNNYLEQYEEMDPDVLCEDDPCDRYYRFQGYQVFQLKSPDVDFWKERYNPEFVREIFQCDIRDEIGDLVNYKYNSAWSSLTDQMEVEAANEGIRHSFELMSDAFPWGESDRLVNHKEMYFVAIAYAGNMENPYSPFDETTFSGQKTVYLTTRHTPEIVSATAHKPDAEANGTMVHSDYGQGMEIIQLAGYGNGNNSLELTRESIDEIMSGSPWKAKNPVYEAGYGPVNVRIVDPLNLPADNYHLFFQPDTASTVWSYGLIKPVARWYLVNSSSDTVFSDQAITFDTHEQIIPECGLSIEITQVEAAGYKNKNPLQNGYISSDITFADDDKKWLTFLPDGDGLDEYNWIRAGTYMSSDINDRDCSYDDYIGYDPDEYFEQILDGGIAPYRLTSGFKYGPAFDQAVSLISIDKYSPLKSIDLVITPDKNKWSRSIVLEMCENEWTINEETGNPEEVQPLINLRSEGNALRFDLRQHPSVDKEGNVIPGDTTHGLGWFPGYAIDVCTGERLNIAFGEDSWLIGENGNDVIWNPTSSIAGLSGPLFGGKHYVYIYGHHEYLLNPQMNTPAYDSCANAYSLMRTYELTENPSYKKHALVGAMWTAIPLLSEEHDMLESEVKIRIRVATPYFQAKAGFVSEDSLNNNLPAYSFSTRDIATETNNPEVAGSALDQIHVVPNPYYGHSFYQSSTEQKVKIINLPTTCVVSVYDVSGRLIRRWDKMSDPSWIDWDLKDSSGKLIGGGVYIIHVDSPGVGEKVVKWFGALSEQ